MADIRPNGRSPTQIACLVAVLSGSVSACASQPVPEQPPDRPAVRVEPTSTTPVFAFEDAGTIIVDSDMVCGESNRPGEEVAVELAGSLVLPDYADAATVLLNGWRLRYLSGDHEVELLNARIVDVTVDPGAINWIARGILEDRNLDDAYEFCYVYTVIGWNSGLIDAVAVNDSVSSFYFSFTNTTDTTALLALSSIAETEPLADRRNLVSLPRGFAKFYGPALDFPPWGGDDHHILQLAYNMDHNEAFLEGGKEYDVSQQAVPSDTRVDPEHRTWESYGIIKDNALRRNAGHSEDVAVLGGNDIAVVRPPFTILPREDNGPFTGCITSNGGVQTEEYVIEDVPFDYALPMLTGWDLKYNCDDEHVTEVGVWLEDFSYEKAPDAPTGTLRYTLGSVLRDKEDPAIRSVTRSMFSD